MKLSQRALNLIPSEPRRIYDEAKKYTHVIDLTLGDPDLPPPSNVQEAACKAIREGRTRYSANAGLPQLREKIAADAAKEYIINTAYDPIYGARPLKRFIQSNIETLAAKKIISGDLPPESEIVIDYDGEKLTAK